MIQWINFNIEKPIDHQPKLVWAVPAKGYKQSLIPAAFMARYCVCKGWEEEISRPLFCVKDEEGREIFYRDLLWQFEITHWAQINGPIITDSNLVIAPSGSSDG
jgi:hypothetical protein